ncbi:hypothetical protein CA12_11220 [Alienimonas californiensis]|uniref:Uncharacterized protein n=1 Tax=Alienimonas californiensis TaxID=2527989 RepID=A0A517P6R4_9PLAN|nr:hypothetical protein CA12_11220 [Alienimonas californiensis]
MLGIGGLTVAAVGLAAAGALCFAFFMVRRSGAYLLGGQRTVGEGSASTAAWLSKTAILLAIFGLAPLALAERFTPEEGLLASIVPPLGDVQSEILDDPAAGAEEQDASVELADAGADGDAQTVLTAGPDVDAFLSDATVSESPAAFAGPSANSLLASASGTSGAEPAATPAAATSGAVRFNDRRPDSATPMNLSGGDARSDGTNVVIAEGVGLNVDEARKDAFREAVRQVVGTVVDAETIVRNDELISDEVLTHSPGFIKTYDDLSQNAEGGLVRVRLRAVVERRSLVARLEAANVTVREVDGSGMFAEAITQLEAEQTAAALIKKAFEGFPQSVMTAEVRGEPMIISKDAEANKVTVRFEVVVRPDLEAWDNFVGRLRPVLEKLATRTRESTVVATFNSEERFHPGFFNVTDRHKEFADGIEEVFPERVERRDLPSAPPVAVTLVVNRSLRGDRLECRTYLLDAAVRPALTEISRRMGSGKLSLVNSDGREIMVDRFPVEFRIGSYSIYFSGSPAASVGRLYGSSEPRVVDWAYEDAERDYLPHANLLWLGPVLLEHGTSDFSYRSDLPLVRDLTLSLDEMKAVQSARCEVRYGN